MKYLTYVAFFLTYACLNLTAQNGITLEYDCDSDCIDLSINGGESPYDVVWNLELGQLGQTFQVSSLTGDPEEDNNREDLCAIRNGGTYTAIVTDAFCGVAEATLTVDKCECLDIKLESFENVSECSSSSGEPGTPGGASSACDGSITISVETEESYHISWVGPDGFTANSEEISGLCPGFYRATVKIKGCEKIFAHNICCCNGSVDDSGEIGSFPYPLCDSEDGTTQPISLEGSIADSPNSRIILSVSGGGTIRYKWTGPDGYTSESMNISNLEPGSYSVRAFDGCSEDRMRFRIVDCNIVGLTVVVFGDDTCDNYCVGDAVAFTSGGMSPYTFQWGDGSSSASIEGLCAGTYCVTVTDVTGCTATGCKVVTSNSPRLVGCNLICNVDDVLELYGPPIWIENPANCIESILVCSQDHSIILEGPITAIRAEFANEELCILEVVNTTSGNVCGTLTGQDCSECLFFPYTTPSDKIEVFSCRYHYCYWPVGPGFYYDKEIEELESAVIFEVGDTGDCIFQLYNGCISSDVDPDPPILVEITGNCAENLISDVSCGQITGEFERGHVECFDTFDDNSEIDLRSFNGISDSIWVLAIESSFTINEDSTSLHETEFEFDPWPIPEITTDITSCSIIISYESDDTYDNMKIKILDENYSLLLAIDTSAVLGENRIVLYDMDELLDNEEYLVLVDLRPDYKLHNTFTASACTNPLQNRIRLNSVINVVPNPFTDNIKVLITDENIRKNAVVIIYDSTGKIVKEVNKINSNDTVDLTNLPNGLYYIEIANQDSIIESIKIIKQ